VAVVVEMILDRSVGGGEFLQGHYVPQLRHRTLSSGRGWFPDERRRSIRSARS
jgi:hypothetical protein